MMLKKFNLNFIFLLVIIIFAAILRLYFYQGVQPTDDEKYLYCANQIFFENKAPDVKTVGRAGMLVPYGMVMKILGRTEYGVMFLSIFISLMNILLAYFIAKILFNKKIALLVAILLATLPIEISLSTRVVPDPLLQFHYAIAFLLFLYFLNTKKKKSKTIYILLVGLFSGFAFLTKITGIFFLVVPLFLLVYKKKKFYYYGFLLFGFLLVVSCDLIWNEYVWDDPLRRITYSNEHIESSIKDYENDKGFLILDPRGNKITPFERFFLGYPQQMFDIINYGAFGLLYIFCGVLCFLYIFYKNKVPFEKKNLYILMIWWVIVFLLLNFMIRNVPPPFIPISRTHARYIMPLNIPLTIILSVLLYYFASFLKRFYRYVLVIIIIGSSILLFLRGNSGSPDNKYGYYYYTVKLAKYLNNKDLRSNKIYMDHRLYKKLRFYKNYEIDYNGKVIYSVDADIANPKTGDLIAINENILKKYYIDKKLSLDIHPKHDNWELAYKVPLGDNIAYDIRNFLYKVILGREFKRKHYFAAIYKVK